MHIERVNSAYRLGLGIALLYLLSFLVPAARNYAVLVSGSARNSQEFNAAHRPKLSPDEEAARRQQEIDAGKQVKLAANPEPALRNQEIPSPGRAKIGATSLELALRQERQFGPHSQLHCEPAARDWDYVCSYAPTPPSPARVQFGVNVDSTRWVNVSAVAPSGTTLPHRQKRPAGGRP